MATLEQVLKGYKRKVSTFTDGIRMIPLGDVSCETEARLDEDGHIEVRIPMKHHKKLSQGWLGGY